MTSFRAEAVGVWSILLFVIKAHRHFNLSPNNKVSIHCDNKALVNMIDHLLQRERPQFPNDTLKTDWDIINEIVSLMKSSKQRITWIKGHQDEGKRVDELSLPAQLNCEADALANEIQQHPFDWEINSLPPPHNPIQVHHHQKTITSHLKRTLRTMIKSKTLIDHVTKRAKWDPDTVHFVDWQSHQRAITTSKLPARFITKFIHQILPTGKVVHRYKPYYNAGCPSCDEQCEDQFHLLTCPAAEQKKWKV